MRRKFCYSAKIYYLCTDFERHGYRYERSRPPKRRFPNYLIEFHCWHSYARMTLTLEKSDVINFPPRRCRWYQYRPSEGKGTAKIQNSFNIDKF